MPTTVRTTQLGVYIHDGVDWQYDATAYAASCSFGFDQRYAEATVRRTGGGVIDVHYWSPIEIRMGTTPGLGEAVRFSGYVVPVDNALYPIEGVLNCKGRLYRAAFVRNNEPGGTALAEEGLGETDEAMVQVVLNACAVPVVATNIGGTGKALGSIYVDLDNLLAAGPFTWAEQQSGLDFIEQLDAVSVPDDASGRFRTFETLAGEVFRTKLATTPTATPDFTFTEGVDVLEARITRDVAGAANRVVVTGAPTPGNVEVPAGSFTATVGAQCRFTAATAFAPYLPPDLPAGPEGFASVTQTFSSPMIEKGENADDGDVLSCEAVAQFLLAEYNCALDTLEFSTPRDDLLGPGQTIHLHSPRLAITDPTQHYWLQHLEISVDERGAFTQRLTCLRKS
jgi:hypothetical protein